MNPLLKRSDMARGSKGITQFYLPPTHEPYLPLLPSRRASPPFGWYSIRLPTEGWPGWVGTVHCCHGNIQQASQWCRLYGVRAPPPIFEPWGSCSISAPQYDKRDNVNSHKLAALQQQRKITNSFNSSVNANDIAAPYLISCVWGKS